MHANLPSLNSIRVFDAAARTGSFKQAAEELHVTPTAVSHQIKSLENTLGTLLFIRKTRAIKLTSDGLLLAKTAYSVLQQLTDTVNEISSTQNTITISTTSAFAAMWLAPNLTKFNQLYPDIEIVINTGEYVDDLEKNRNVDIAIRYGIYNPSIPNTSFLATEKIGMYATPSYVKNLASKNIINLLETKWLRRDTSLSEFSWYKLIQHSKTDKQRENISQFTQEHHIIQAALAGQGIALVSNLLVANAVKQGWLTRFNYVKGIDEIEGLSYYLLVAEHNSRSRSIITFKEWLINELTP